MRSKDLLHEFEVLGVNLVIVLGLLVLKLDVQGRLVGLIHHRPMAGHHFTNMQVEDAWNRREVFPDSLNEFIHRIGLPWIRPKDDHVAIHGLI